MHSLCISMMCRKISVSVASANTIIIEIIIRLATWIKDDLERVDSKKVNITK